MLKTYRSYYPTYDKCNEDLYRISEVRASEDAPVKNQDCQFRQPDSEGVEPRVYPEEMEIVVRDMFEGETNVLEVES